MAGEGAVEEARTHVVERDLGSGAQGKARLVVHGQQWHRRESGRQVSMGRKTKRMDKEHRARAKP